MQLLLLLSFPCYRIGGYHVRKSLSVQLARTMHINLIGSVVFVTFQVNSFSIKFSHSSTELNCQNEIEGYPPLYFDSAVRFVLKLTNNSLVLFAIKKKIESHLCLSNQLISFESDKIDMQWEMYFNQL